MTDGGVPGDDGRSGVWRRELGAPRWMHRAATVWQCQAVCIFLALFVAWRWAAWRRRIGRREIDRRGTARTPYCVDDEEASAGEAAEMDAEATAGDGAGAEAATIGPPVAPMVTVVMPVKGVRAESLNNWRTQLVSGYRGALEYVFVVEAKDDPAAAVVEQLAAEQRAGRKPKRERGGTPNGIVRLVVAGSSKTCSQKIHSMLAGVGAASPASEFVLFLDDDIRLHRNTVGALVHSMKTHEPNMFLSNGFPFDLPPADGSFANYLTMVYHMVLLVAFSHGEWTKNVWGGCMMLRIKDFREDTHGVASKYRDGGYSDDLILAALCDEHGRRVGCPHVALFPQHMPASQSLVQWWNYLRRQLFVMDTYVTFHNRLVNHGMLLAISYLSVAAISALAFCALNLAWWGASAVSAAAAGERVVVFLPTREALSLGVVAAFALALSGARAMYWRMGELARRIGDEEAMEAVRVINWWRVAAAFVVNYALVIFAVGVTLVKPTIDWAGIRYRKSGGKVVRIN